MNIFDDLIKLARERKSNPKEGSYINELLGNKSLSKAKVLEEITELIEEVLKKQILDTKIILNSDSIEKKSKLRFLFEKEKKLICIPFYEDNNQILFQICQNFFRKENIKISSEIIIISG